MTRDYASRGAPGSKPRKTQAARRSNRPPLRVSHPVFSAPSFSAGVVFGAALVILAAYAPAIFEETRTAVRGEERPVKPEITFDFPEVLRDSKVLTDPKAYKSGAPEQPGSGPQLYLLQAASLRADSDAEALRARLTLQGLPASSDKVVLASGTWYRVTVGPFTSQVEANRAMTRLREMNLSALMLKHG